MMSSVAMTATDVHRTIDALWRIESGRLIAGLARLVRDVGRAEELAQDALVTALEQWPRSGIPDNPGAWLMATAKHRAIDHLRRERMLTRKHEALGHELEMDQQSNGGKLEASADDEIGDDLLRLMFIACHPLLSTEARTALTLRLLAGLTTEEIARASPSRSLGAASSPRGCPRCSKSSTWCSTRAIPPPRARTGCGRACVKRRSGSVASSPSSRRWSRKFTDSWR